MLQAMRDRVMGVLGWIVIGLIIITFALFGLGSYMQDRSRLFAAKVNDVEITPRELQMAYQQQRDQMQEMLGDAYDPALLSDKLLRQRALDALISRELVLQASQDAGMAISDQLLAANIHTAPVFQEDGGFSEQRYQRLLYQQGQTPASFEYDTRRRLQVEQLVNGLSQTAFVTGTELEQAYRLQEQTRDFSYWIISPQPFQATVEISDQQIEDSLHQADCDGRAAGPTEQLELERALARLADTPRLVVWLHDVEGFTHAEIGRLFGRTPSFSKSQLARAHQRLRELLEPDGVHTQCMPVSTSC